MLSNVWLVIAFVAHLIVLILCYVDYAYRDVAQESMIHKMMLETCACNDWEFGGCTNRASAMVLSDWKSNFTTIVNQRIIEQDHEYLKSAHALFLSHPEFIIGFQVITVLQISYKIIQLSYNLLETKVLEPRREHLIKERLERERRVREVNHWE